MRRRSKFLFAWMGYRVETDQLTCLRERNLLGTSYGAG